MTTNFEAAVKAEAKTAVRCFQHYTSEQRANHAASHRLGYLQRQAVGEFYWAHPKVSGLAFPTRRRAAEAAVEAA